MGRTPHLEAWVYSLRIHPYGQLCIRRYYP